MNLGLKPLSFTSLSSSWKSSDGVPGQFPAGLRVLVVDDDPTCLRILDKMLNNCLYEVTTCNRAELALKFLRDNKNGYDVVLSDVHMPDMDGFKLLEHIGLEMDLPVIMMSADDSRNIVMKGVTHGACDYLIKPVRMEALKNIWQHVVRKRKHEWKGKDYEQLASADNGEQLQKPPEDANYYDGNSIKNLKKRKHEEDEAEEREDSSSLKKPRVVWSVDLHQQFVTAVNQLGIDKAVPKKILDLMNVPGLTRENVASHLQKYRLYLRRLSSVSQHHNGVGNPFLGAPDAPFRPSNDLQALAAVGQLPLRSLPTIQAAQIGQGNAKPAVSVPLLDERSIFYFENPKLSFVEGQQQQNSNRKQMNVLNGIPTNMDSKQLAALRESVRPFGNVNGSAHSEGSQSSALPLQMVQRQPRMQVFSKTNERRVPNLEYTSVSQPSAIVDFARRHSSTEFPENSFSCVSSSGVSSFSSTLKDEVSSEITRSRGFLSNYNICSDLNPNGAWDRCLSNGGSTFEAPRQSSVQRGLNVLPSVTVQQRYCSNQESGCKIPSADQAAFSVAERVGDAPNPNWSAASDPLRIKAENLPDMCFSGSLFPEAFGEEDIMPALLKQQQEGLETIETEIGYNGHQLYNLPA